MPQLVLLRHGQSVWNAENLFTGWYDVDLTAQGEEVLGVPERLTVAEEDQLRHAASVSRGWGTMDHQNYAENLLLRHSSLL